MAKWYGKIGYSETVETSPGVWEETITERDYYGDLIRNNRRINEGSKVVDDISISNELSIIADPYAISNFHHIKYVVYMGIKWKVSSVDVMFPRLNLSFGGIYNE